MKRILAALCVCLMGISFRPAPAPAAPASHGQCYTAEQLTVLDKQDIADKGTLPPAVQQHGQDQTDPYNNWGDILIADGMSDEDRKAYIRFINLYARSRHEPGARTRTAPSSPYSGTGESDEN